MTENQAGKSLPFDSTSWRSAGFVGQYQDLSFQPGMVREIPHIQQLSNLQKDIWDKFQPWCK
jgi:hypothetical protein